jgi:hypothetical protein
MTTSIRLPWLVTSSSSFSSYNLFYYWSESLLWNRNVSNGPLCSSFFYDAGCRICYWPSHEASCVCKACTHMRYWCRLLLGQLFVVSSIHCAFSPYREPQSPHHMLGAEKPLCIIAFCLLNRIWSTTRFSQSSDSLMYRIITKGSSLPLVMIFHLINAW